LCLDEHVTYFILPRIEGHFVRWLFIDDELLLEQQTDKRIVNIIRKYSLDFNYCFNHWKAVYKHEQRHVLEQTKYKQWIFEQYPQCYKIIKDYDFSDMKSIDLLRNVSIRQAITTICKLENKRQQLVVAQSSITSLTAATTSMQGCLPKPQS
ncbi:unnamed protein product, partial [Didymodactylos carnosus]